MKIALDISPVADNNFLQHQVRGAGFYVNNLIESLRKYFPQNEYLLIKRGQKLPKNTNLIHYPYFEPFVFNRNLLTKIPMVLTIHDLTPLVFPEHFPVGIKGRIKWEINKQLLKKVTVIITDSENSKKDIVKFTGISLEKIHVVYLAPGEKFVKLETRKKYHLPEKFVLYVGDVTWNKNLPRLIEAMKRVDLPLVMVGKALVNDDYDKTNPWNQDLMKVQKMAENNKTSFSANAKIIRLGFVETNDLVRVYNLAEVLVMPSLYEGFGLPVLEAMSCGCPVIAGNAGSLPEVVGEAGILVDPNNTEEIGNKLLWIFKLPRKEREELIKKGFVQAKKFNWKKTAAETIKIYEQAFTTS